MRVDDVEHVVIIAAQVTWWRIMFYLGGGFNFNIFPNSSKFSPTSGKIFSKVPVTCSMRSLET